MPRRRTPQTPYGLNPQLVAYWQKGTLPADRDAAAEIFFQSIEQRERLTRTLGPQWSEYADDDTTTTT